MAAIIKRLSDLEADVKELQRKKSLIPVLFVTEYPEGIYTEQNGAVFSNEAELRQFADEHGTVTIINNDLRLKGRKANEINYSTIGSIGSTESAEHCPASDV